MFRNRTFAVIAALAWSAGIAGAQSQDRRSRIDVDQYTIDAEISPNTQSIAAKAAVRFTPVDDNVTSVAFELNNALNVTRVVDEQGKQIPMSRNQQDFTVRLTFEPPLAKGHPVTISFYYEGKLTGQEDSPIYGVKFAAIHPDFAYLLYPARWFPVSGYSTDRFQSDFRITVPAGYTVLASGLDRKETVGDKNRYQIRFEHPSFPGSIAVVKGEPAKIASEAWMPYFKLVRIPCGCGMPLSLNIPQERGSQILPRNCHRQSVQIDRRQASFH